MKKFLSILLALLVLLSLTVFSFADDLPLQEWLYDKVFPHEAKLNGESIVPFTKLGIMEYLTSGITGIVDQYFYPEEFEIRFK